MPTRRTAEHLYDLIEQQILPPLTEVRADVSEMKSSMKNAGLWNGQSLEAGADLKRFLDSRAKRRAAFEYLNEIFQPVRRFKFLAYLVGFIASVGWAVMAVNGVISLIEIHRK